MTSNKVIVFGFLIIALGFAFLLIALTTATTAPPNTLPVNAFVSIPVRLNTAGIVQAFGIEQETGVTLVLIGVITGAVGCFRKDAPTRP